MVCASVIFIPGVMIYQWVKAWKATRYHQNQVTAGLNTRYSKFVISFRFRAIDHITYGCWNMLVNQQTIGDQQEKKINMADTRI